MKKDISSKVLLNNGVEMPYLGLGVFRAGAGKETVNAVHYALEHGYRLIDTASMYENEKEVGQAVRESSIPREDIFITTKLWNSDHGYDKTMRAFQKSLTELGLDYIDLYLIHWPVEGLRDETWKAMIALRDQGKCRTIGVSNYTIRHLEELLSHTEVIPAVNQVEFSPFLYQKELLEFCRKHEIQLEAYSPVARGQKFDNKTLRSVAEKYDKTPAQIMIRWALQHDLVVIPKSAHRDRIRENADIFDFSIAEDDMERLNSLNENYRVSWDPSHVA